MSIPDNIHGLAKLYHDVATLLKRVQKLDDNREDNLVRLQTTMMRLKRLINNDHFPPQLRNWVTTYEQSLAETEQSVRARFGVELATVLKGALNASFTGNYPIFTIGLYTLECDVKKDVVTIWYGPKAERLAACRHRASDVLSTVSEVEKRLKSIFDPDGFIKTLHEAYEHKSKGLAGEPVSLVELLQAIQPDDSRSNVDLSSAPKPNAVSSYERAQFSYDLHRIRERHQIKLSVATRKDTRTKDTSLWIPDSDSTRGQMFSTLTFLE